MASTSHFTAALFRLFERVVSDTARPPLLTNEGLPVGSTQLLPLSLVHVLESDDLELRRFVLLEIAESVFRCNNNAYAKFNFDYEHEDTIESRKLQEQRRTVVFESPPDVQTWQEYYHARSSEALTRERELFRAREYEECVSSVLQSARTQVCLKDCTRLFEAFKAAHPYQVNEIRIEFLSVKLQMTFGCDSTFWRSTLIKKKTIRTAAEMDEIIATVSMLANVTPTWLIERLTQSLTDLDMFYMSLVHPATKKTVAEVMNEIAIVFAQHAERPSDLDEDQSFPHLSLKGWLRVAGPWFDSAFDENIAEEIFYRAILKTMSISHKRSIKTQQHKSLLLTRLAMQEHAPDSSSSSSLSVRMQPPGSINLAACSRSGTGATIESIIMTIDAFATALVIAATFKIPNPMIQMERKIKPFIFTWLLPLGAKGKKCS